MRSPAGIMSAGVIGGAIVYVIMRWGLLPPFNPMMAFVAQMASSSPACCSTSWVEVVLAVAFQRPQLGPGAARQPVTSSWTARHELKPPAPTAQAPDLARAASPVRSTTSMVL
jgi:hypothetical protein